MVAMASGRSKNAFPMWVLLAALVSQNMAIPVMCRSLEGFEDQKNYYPPDPHGTPRSSPRTPSHGTPSHGSGGGGSCGTPPSHSGGGYSYSPPSGHSTPAISPPSVVTPPPNPSPYVPGTPSTPTHVPGTPSTPTYVPGTPSTPVDPNHPPYLPGTCNFWSTHPQLIWGILGFWGTMGSIFGAAGGGAFGHNLSLRDALANTRSDGIGSLYREGAASYLNSVASNRFPFTTEQVQNKFTAALVSNKAADAQARMFKLANEGKLNA